MYQPPVFAETDPDALYRLIRENPFAVLVTCDRDRSVEANHIPMILQADEGADGVLRGHVSRANPLWRDYDPTVDALAIFQGPHHYVTPSWYPSKAAHGRVVPTWNYAVVHARGPMTIVEDPARLRVHVRALTDAREAGRTAPWKVGDAPAGFIEKQLQGIVGLELRIGRIEGKWKMSQNREAGDRAGVVRGLGAEGSDMAARVAREILDPGGD